jgi:hypothetical protein
MPNGKIDIDEYLQHKASQRKKTQTTPPTPLPQIRVRQPKKPTFTTKSINSDLDASLSGYYEIAYHPTNRAEALIHAPDGRLITAITKLSYKN